MSRNAALSELLSGAAYAEPGAPLVERLGGREPEALLRPDSTEEVAAVLRWASDEGVGVVTIGSGTHLLGEAPEDRFVVLSTDRLTGLEIYEAADLTLTARAGTPLLDLGKTLSEHGQWLPFDPPDVGARTLGGLVASGESGPLWMGYGALRNHVLGAVLVTGDGRILRLGGRVVKNVAGFDLLKVVVGSRGRLGVVTSVCLRAFPEPVGERVLVRRGRDLAELVPLALAVGTAPSQPASVVLLTPVPGMSEGAALIVRLHGAEATVEHDQAVLERHGDTRFERLEDPGPLLEAAGTQSYGRGVMLLLSVLPTRLPEAIAAIRAAAGDADLVIDTYGGAIRAAVGEGEAEDATRLRAAVERLGGTITVHAPPGARSVWERTPRTPEEAELESGVLSAFDPRGVLWPRPS